MRVVADRLDLASSASTVIVGGTNGKGSTCAMLDSILRAAGYRTGLYTSPHLLEFNERARIDGVDASDEQLIESFEAVEAVRGATSLTYFEFTTLAILRLFAQARLDAVVLEVGLGGRLDAVNLVDADVSIVTSVDIDHIDYLGPTRESIGLEKAHIYRPGRAAICSDPRPPQSLLDHAESIGADLWRIRARLQLPGRPAAMGLWRTPRPSQRAAVSRAARCEPVAERIRCAGGTRGARRATARFAAGGSTRLAHGGASGALPGPAGASGHDPRRGTQSARGGRAGRESRQHGLLSGDACRVWHAGRQGHRGRRRQARQPYRSLARGTDARAPRNERSADRRHSCARPVLALHPGSRSRSTPHSRMRMPLHGTAHPPMIEFSPSVPSSPWPT